MTERISTILTLVKEFDDIQNFKVNNRIDRLIRIKREINLIGKERFIDYHNFLWPPIIYQRIPLTIGGLTQEEIQAQFDERDINGHKRLSMFDKDKRVMEKIFESGEFKELEKHPKKLTLIKLSIRSLMITTKYPDISEIYKAAKKLGLLLCPIGVIPYLPLLDKSEVISKAYGVAVDDKNSFYLSSNFDGSKRFLCDLLLFNGFEPDQEFVFRVPDLEDNE